MPLYIPGFMGMTRRMQSYPNPEYQPLLVIAMVGAFIIGAGILCQIIQWPCPSATARRPPI